jgi:hypothetical protein
MDGQKTVVKLRKSNDHFLFPSPAMRYAARATKAATRLRVLECFRVVVVNSGQFPALNPAHQSRPELRESGPEWLPVG